MFRIISPCFVIAFTTFLCSLVVWDFNRCEDTTKCFSSLHAH